MSVSWAFGDGETSSAANPQHRFADGGDYTVALTVEDNRGGQTTSEVEVSVT